MARLRCTLLLAVVRLRVKVIKDMEEDLDDPEKSLIHVQDEKNRTPLNYSTRGDLYRHAQLLVQYGADVEAPEADTNRSIILNAIYRNSHNVIPLLPDHGARTDVCEVYGATILHHISRFGSLQMMQAFAGYRLGPVDPNALDSHGLTSIEAFNSTDARCSPDNVADRTEAVKLFKSILVNIVHPHDIRELVTEIGSDQDSVGTGDEEFLSESIVMYDEEDLFEDAQEALTHYEEK